MVIVDTCPNWILVWTSKLDSSLEKAAIQNVAALHYMCVPCGRNKRMFRDYTSELHICNCIDGWKWSTRSVHARE